MDASITSYFEVYQELKKIVVGQESSVTIGDSVNPLRALARLLCPSFVGFGKRFYAERVFD